jgi:hypothetical protein
MLRTGELGLAADITMHAKWPDTGGAVVICQTFAVSKHLVGVAQATST